MCVCCQCQHSPGAPVLFCWSFLGTWEGGGGVKSLRGLGFVLLCVFFPSCFWLIQQVDGKHWAMCLTALFLNFLISNAVLFMRSFEILCKCTECSVASRRRYLISSPLGASLQGRPPASGALGVIVHRQVPRPTPNLPN